jgi:hypothetical protein
MIETETVGVGLEGIWAEGGRGIECLRLTLKVMTS